MPWLISQRQLPCGPNKPIRKYNQRLKIIQNRCISNSYEIRNQCAHMLPAASNTNEVKYVHTSENNDAWGAATLPRIDARLEQDIFEVVVPLLHLMLELAFVKRCAQVIGKRVFFNWFVFFPLFLVVCVFLSCAVRPCKVRISNLGWFRILK